MVNMIKVNHVFHLQEPGKRLVMRVLHRAICERRHNPPTHTVRNSKKQTVLFALCYLRNRDQFPTSLFLYKTLYGLAIFILNFYKIKSVF
jgi:hypothetical protein